MGDLSIANINVYKLPTPSPHPAPYSKLHNVLLPRLWGPLTLRSHDNSIISIIPPVPVQMLHKMFGYVYKKWTVQMIANDCNLKTWMFRAFGEDPPTKLPFGVTNRRESVAIIYPEK